MVDQLDARLGFLRDVGLGYLTLDRQTRTLSGGEAQRISLANALGSRLVDTLYVLDEPSVGLHPRDTDRLLALLRRLRDAGNTVIVVEHDLAAIRQADFMLELGPRLGRPAADASSTPARSRTRARLPHRPVPHRRKADRRARARGGRPGPHWLRVRGATLHNLNGVDVDIPLGTLTAVTGVSGSGKSTLLYDVIYRESRGQAPRRALRQEPSGGAGRRGRRRSPGGSCSRTCCSWTSRRSAARRAPIPITYIKAFDEIRELFAAQPLARQRKYTAGDLLVQPAGRALRGAARAPATCRSRWSSWPTSSCPARSAAERRYRREVLDVRIQGHSIHDVLQWTVDEAIARFRHQPKLGAALWQLQQVGLGYLRLGQPATTLSGGEAQRLKIARELAQAGKREGRKLYILDEPTTGLHLDDVRVLIQVLDRLVDAGHTVVVIEHHLDVIKRADWIVDLGPEAGDAGGRLVAQGTPEDVAAVEESHTGRYLRPLWASRPRPRRWQGEPAICHPERTRGILPENGPSVAEQILRSRSPPEPFAGAQGELRGLPQDDTALTDFREAHQRPLAASRIPPTRPRRAPAPLPAGPPRDGSRSARPAACGSDSARDRRSPRREPRVERVELLLRPSRRPPPEAHQPERHRRHTSKSGSSATQPASSRASATCAADHRPQPLDPVTPDHEPELERPEAAAELDAPVAEVDHLGVVSGAEIFGRGLEGRAAAPPGRARSTRCSRSWSAATCAG